MKKNDRFIQIYTEGNALGYTKTIFVDRETGVHYLFIKSGYGSSITPLLGSDGTPVVRKTFDYGE